MKLKPRLRRRHKYVDFADLKVGDGFINDEELYVKIGYGDQMAISLTDPHDWCDDNCGTEVIPVDIEITWSYKK